MTVVITGEARAEHAPDGEKVIFLTADEVATLCCHVDSSGELGGETFRFAATAKVLWAGAEVLQQFNNEGDYDGRDQNEPRPDDAAGAEPEHPAGTKRAQAGKTGRGWASRL
jgi:hypothetical protein